MANESKTSTAAGCGILLVAGAAVVWAAYFFGRRWPLATGIAVALLALLFVAWIISIRRKQREKWHEPIIEQILLELIKLLPSHWNEAELTLTAPIQGIGQGVAHAVTSPEGHTDPVFPSSSELLFATRELELGSKQRDMRWKRVVIRIKKAGDAWQSVADFEY